MRSAVRCFEDMQAVLCFRITCLKACWSVRGVSQRLCGHCSAKVQNQSS